MPIGQKGSYKENNIYYRPNNANNTKQGYKKREKLSGSAMERSVSKQVVDFLFIRIVSTLTM